MKRILTGAALLGAATLASAHGGHGATSLFEGLTHPLGADHLLAMVAVGLWSALALPGARRWFGPLTFLLAMAFGAALGIAGLALPLTEAGIALSVAVFGLMLVAGRRLPATAGLTLVAGAALLHGLAHGAALPSGGSVASYGAGFLVTTLLMHVAGVGFGAALRDAKAAVWRVLGSALGGAGFVLLMTRI